MDEGKNDRKAFEDAPPPGMLPDGRLNVKSPEEVEAFLAERNRDPELTDEEMAEAIEAGLKSAGEGQHEEKSD